MMDDTPRWIARLAPAAGHSVDELLGLPLGLDVWERRPQSLVVAATESQLAEIERRRLANVDRIETVAEFVSRQESPGEP